MKSHNTWPFVSGFFHVLRFMHVVVLPVVCSVNCWIAFRCIDVPHFVYPFLSSWTSGLFTGVV